MAWGREIWSVAARGLSFSQIDPTTFTVRTTFVVSSHRVEGRPVPVVWVL